MIITRKAKIKDVSIIAKLAVNLLKYHANFDSYFAPAKNAEDIYAKYFFKCIYSPKKQLLVAEYNNEIAGYALIEITSRPPVLKVKTMGLVNDIFYFRSRKFSQKRCWQTTFYWFIRLDKK